MENYFDQNLKYLLENKGLSTEDLASNLKVSVTGSQIYVGDLLKISNYFNLTVDQLLTQNLSVSLKKRDDIKLLILDVDGVLTTGGMYFTEKGDELKQFNTKDGRGIISFVKQGGNVGIISSGFKNEIIKSRAKMLGINLVYVGTQAKEEILGKWIDQLEINWSNVAYIGDDINDLNVMRKVGFSSCPADAVSEIKEISDIILTKEGGKGCVRELIGTYLCEVKM